MILTLWLKAVASISTLSLTDNRAMTSSDIESMTFEEALRELEEIVRKLEDINNTLTLEDSIQAYERGTALKQHCEAKLKDAQMKIEVLPTHNKSNS